MDATSLVSSLRERRTRLALYVVVAVVLFGSLGVQALMTDGAEGGTTSKDGRWTSSPTTDPGAGGGTGTDSGENETNESDVVSSHGRTGVLVTVQSYGGFGNNNGRAVLVQDGEVVWSFAPEDSRVFDAEMLDNGNVLVSYATRIPAEDCPERTLEYEDDHCVRNNVVELDYGTKDVVWEYRWLDAFMDYHEVHDADRLPNGETAIIDMGNDRSFVVDQNESIVWEWSAREHIGPGSEFWETYGGPSEPAPESDWTHMNDIDRMENGHFLMSIRNFDVLLEVNRSTKAIERVIGQPRETDKEVEGREPVLDDQHNPMMVSDDNVVVADSETDRIVEIDAETGEAVWSYSDGLLWPRDADRLPNGNTLVTNSLRYEVLEVTPDGEIVWRYEVSHGGQRGIPYEADRVAIPEEPPEMPSIYEIRGDARTTTAPTGSETAAGTGTETGSASETGTPSPTATGGEATSSPNVDGSADGDSESALDRYRGYLLFYLPNWVGAFEVTGLAIVALAAIAEGVAFAAAGVRRQLAS